MLSAAQRHAFATAARIANPQQLRWRADPAAWARERLGAELWSKQVELMSSVGANRRTAVRSGHGTGKGLPLDTPIPTPTGWTVMGALQPGDQVLDESGLPCTVLTVSEIHERPCYRVTLTDGFSLITDDQHLWSTLTLPNRKILRRRYGNPDDWRTYWDHAALITTADMARTVMTAGDQRQHAIPVTAPLQLPEQEFAVHPYVLGVWLGDGHTDSAHITADVNKAPIVERLQALGENVYKTKPGIIWSMAGIGSDDRAKFVQRLRAIGVLGAKHIPDVYLRASLAQRIDLLHGIMDTDGFATPDRGVVGIDLMDERLIGGVAELIRTFGWKVNIKPGRTYLDGRDVGTRYRLSFRPDFCPFSLPYKADAWVPPGMQRGRNTIHTVASVEPTLTVPTQCITVDSPRQMYLATERFIPTHNTWSAGVLALWWIDTHPPGTAFVISTAPSYAQVHALLWEEIRKGHRRGGLPGTVTLDDTWKLADGTLVGQGRKPPNHVEDAFQGLHRPFVLALLDEACGLPPWMWVAVETVTTNDNSRLLAIGNPDDPQSEFFNVNKPDSGWNIIKISVLDSPNLTGEPVSDELRASLTSREWVEDKKTRWGENSALYQAKVLAEFPVGQDPWIVVPYPTIRQCQHLEYPASGDAEGGIDIGAGGDRTVLRERRGMRAGREFSFVDADPMKSVGALVEKINEWGLTKVKVDVIGVGWGLTGRLKELSTRHNPTGAHQCTHHAEVVGINVAEKPSPGSEDKYLNLRAELWWMARENSRLKLWDLSEVDDDTVAELSAPRYEIMDSRGKVKVEAKKDIIKRMGLSPDRADALLLAFSTPSTTVVMPPQYAMRQDLTANLTPGSYGTY